MRSTYDVPHTHTHTRDGRWSHAARAAAYQFFGWLRLPPMMMIIVIIVLTCFCLCCGSLTMYASSARAHSPSNHPQSFQCSIFNHYYYICTISECVCVWICLFDCRRHRGHWPNKWNNIVQFGNLLTMTIIVRAEWLLILFWWWWLILCIRHDIQNEIFEWRTCMKFEYFFSEADQKKYRFWSIAVMCALNRLHFRDCHRDWFQWTEEKKLDWISS